MCFHSYDLTMLTVFLNLAIYKDTVGIEYFIGNNFMVVPLNSATKIFCRRNFHWCMSLQNFQKVTSDMCDSWRRINFVCFSCVTSKMKP